MQKTILICDHCGKEVPGTLRFTVPVGTQIDPPSGKTETTDETVDLCPAAQARIVTSYIGDVPARAPGEGHRDHLDLLVTRGKTFVARWKKHRA